uniref:Protein quiver n=1 Tax=Angiostrongylus cantonensis TaxID=6313 RepID=A0A0K0DIR1_ANGCA
MFRSIVLSACISSCLAVTCYDCYNTGPNHETCTRDRKCSGLACVIYDTGDDKKTMTAFCLLAMGGLNRSDSCWLDPDGPGRHCICYSDFCNHLIGTAIEFFNGTSLDAPVTVGYKNEDRDWEKLSGIHSTSSNIVRGS